jgi:F-type H+-transporting ATPase subunit a
MDAHLSWVYFLKHPLLTIYPHVIEAIFVGVLLGLMVWGVRRSIAKRQSVIPQKKFSFLNLAEVYVNFIRKFCFDTIGPNGEKYVPLAGTLFLFILACNLLGTVPGFTPPTDNLNLTLALGLFAFLYYNYQGIKEHGFGYIKQFLGPTSSKMFIPIIPLMLVIELVSHVVRPLSLGLRLRGNIYGDHAVHSVFAGLIPYGVPIVFLCLGIFVAFIQAFVFTLLTMVYISLAESHDH